MGYTKSELRNTHKPLLRRIQRQIDVTNKTSTVVPKEKEIFEGQLSTLSIDEIDTTDNLILKDTRLKLYKKRGGR